MKILQLADRGGTGYGQETPMPYPAYVACLHMLLAYFPMLLAYFPVLLACLPVLHMFILLAQQRWF